MENPTLHNLIERYLNAYNTFDMAGMLETLHRDIHFRNISGGEVTSETRGIQEFRALAEQSVHVFSQRHQTVRTIAFSEDRAEADIDYEAVLAADLPNGMKAGETLKLQGRSIFHMQEKKLIRIEDYS